MFKGTESYGPGEFSRIVAAEGGRENAFTGQDYTAYFQSLASDRLEVSFKLESDRMANLRLRDEDFVKERAVVFHRSRAWTDAGSQGYELLLEDGRLSAALIHFWPGNAIRIRTKEPIAVGQWLHVVMAYDGSSRAAGLTLYLNGQAADCDVVRDNLFKEITGGGANELTLGQRFRDRGFKNGLVDELKIFDRCLTPLEAQHGRRDSACRDVEGILSQSPDVEYCLGFAMVAYPAEHGASGVMTFIVSRNGKIYEKDLGRNSAQIGAQMTTFNPGPGWKELAP